MKQLKKDIQAVSKSLKALAQKTEKMMKRVSELEKAQAKAKPRKAAKKPAAGKAAAKKAAKATATDKVINIITKAKEGAGVAALAKQTGIEDKKIRNIIFRALKQDKIKRAGRGVYVGV